MSFILPIYAFEAQFVFFSPMAMTPLSPLCLSWPCLSFPPPSCEHTVPHLLFTFRRCRLWCFCFPDFPIFSFLAFPLQLCFLSFTCDCFTYVSIPFLRNLLVPPLLRFCLLPPHALLWLQPFLTKSLSSHPHKLRSWAFTPHPISVPFADLLSLSEVPQHPPNTGLCPLNPPF